MIFPVFYFGPISYYSKLIQQDEFSFERFENFKKQTYRNRCYIQGANGKLRLAIPIAHDGKRRMKDIRVSEDSAWRKEHFTSLVSAYRSSPFFEFYEDDLEELYLNPVESLFDFNLKTIEFISKKLKIELKFDFTTEYNEIPAEQDFRLSFDSKREPNPELFPVYTQVFGEKFDFLADLSILDLLFNEGPKSIDYLKQISD